MRALPLAVALAVSAVPWLAHAQMGEPTHVSFTADGKQLVVEIADENGKPGGLFLFDARTADRLDGEGDAPDIAPADAKAWLAKQKLVPVKAADRSPDGTTSLVVRGGDGKGAKRVTGPTTWSADGEPPDLSMPPPLVLSLKGRGAERRSATFEGGKNVVKSVDVYWAPDGRRVFYVVRTTSAPGTAIASTFEVRVAPVREPWVQVVASKGYDPDASQAALDKLEAAGLVTTGVGLAQSAHARTTVYFAKNFQAEAKRAADALGATLEPLSWKASADVVVALGSK